MKSGKAARFAERRAENNVKAACPQFESNHPEGAAVLPRSVQGAFRSFRNLNRRGVPP